jgi:type IV secretory pathway protease TraF
MAAIAAAYVARLIGFEVHAPLIVYNASGSAPLGFYYPENRPLRRGELAHRRRVLG